MIAYNENDNHKQLEYDLFDGESFHFFTILSVDEEKNEIALVVQNLGKITFTTYDLLTDDLGETYFEYGPSREKVYLNDFSKELPY